MATLGLRYMAWSRIATESAAAIPTYNAGMVLGKAVSINVAITNAEGELHADDLLAEYASEFSSAALTAEVDNIPLAKQAIVYGASYINDEMQFCADDSAPYGGVGGYQVLMVSGVRKYRTWFFPKGRAIVPDWSGTTKSGSISFGTQPISIKIMSPAYGPWYYVKEFATEEAAKAYIDAKLNVATWYAANVQVNGAGSGEGASPVGTNAVASGADFVLTITGTPIALYDNGVDSVSAISSGKYTISATAADHDIAVIF